MMHFTSFLTTVVVLLACVSECCMANVKRVPDYFRRPDYDRQVASSGTPNRKTIMNQKYTNNKRRNVDSDTAIIFPTDGGTSRSTLRPITYQPGDKPRNSVNEIPISLFYQINKITNQSDFTRQFTINGPRVLGSSQVNSRGSDNNSISGRTLTAPFAQPAVCTPQLATVPIEISRDPYDFYFPSCTRLERCGGCCSHQIFECSPTKTEDATFQVIKTRYLGPELNKFDVGTPVEIKLVRHLECQCQCKVKSGDCRPNQVYRPNECRCECINQDEAANCDGEKFWDTNLCLCRCREHVECSTGLTFNSDTCSCGMSPVSRIGVQPGPGFRGI